jgi:hypothetical protein
MALDPLKNKTYHSTGFPLDDATRARIAGNAPAQLEARERERMGNDDPFVSGVGETQIDAPSLSTTTTAELRERERMGNDVNGESTTTTRDKANAEAAAFLATLKGEEEIATSTNKIIDKLQSEHEVTLDELHSKTDDIIARYSAHSTDEAAAANDLLANVNGNGDGDDGDDENAAAPLSFIRKAFARAFSSTPAKGDDGDADAPSPPLASFATSRGELTTPVKGASGAAGKENAKENVKENANENANEIAKENVNENVKVAAEENVKENVPEAAKAAKKELPQETADWLQDLMELAD